MVLGWGKKALNNELRNRIEKILSVLDKCLPSPEQPDEAPVADADSSTATQHSNLLSSVGTIKDTIQIMEQRAAELSSGRTRLLQEYNQFVNSCQSKADLERGKRYQTASDFFSYLAAQIGRQRKATEAMGQDLAGLSEELEGFDQRLADALGSTQGAAGARPEANLADKAVELKRLVTELAELLSIELGTKSEDEPSDKS